MIHLLLSQNELLTKEQEKEGQRGRKEEKGNSHDETSGQM